MKSQKRHSGVYRDVVNAAVELEFGMPVIWGKGTGRGSANMVLVRQVALYLFQTQYAGATAVTARTYGRDPKTVSHACQVIERIREDTVFDEKVSRLERFLQSVPGPKLKGGYQ